MLSQEKVWDAKSYHGISQQTVDAVRIKSVAEDRQTVRCLMQDTSRFFWGGGWTGPGDVTKPAVIVCIDGCTWNLSACFAINCCITCTVDVKSDVWSYGHWHRGTLAIYWPYMTDRGHGQIAPPESATGYDPSNLQECLELQSGSRTADVV